MKSVRAKIGALQHRDVHTRWPKSRFAEAKRSAKKRGHSWDMTFQDYALLIDLPCHYCHAKKFEAGTGLDRLNNAKGYSVKNVVPCCWACNMLKGVMPTEFFLWCVRRVASG